jgi:hypothetical protein
MPMEWMNEWINEWIIQICHLAIFFIPKTEMSTEMPSLCWHSGHSDSHDKTALQHSRKCFQDCSKDLQKHW